MATGGKSFPGCFWETPKNPGTQQRAAVNEPTQFQKGKGVKTLRALELRKKRESCRGEDGPFGGKSRTGRDRGMR